MFDLSLRHALNALLTGTERARVIEDARKLSVLYRSGCFTDRDQPVLALPHNALAYAAVRMPATYAAVRTAMHAAADHVEFTPRTHLDLGGGTGAAVWAAAAVWPGIESCVLEQSVAAGEVGRSLIAHSSLRPADWVRRNLLDDAPWPQADLMTITYVLGELPERARDEVVARTASAGLVIVVEPGTPGGYERIMAARDVLIGNGMAIAAPCPHELPCPLGNGSNWCHFGARVDRSALHRVAKAGTRNYEDEKFAYVVATRKQARPAEARVISRPIYRKNRVDLSLCRRNPACIVLETVAKSASEYKAARHANWGEEWSANSD